MATAKYHREWRKKNPGRASLYVTKHNEQKKKDDPLYYVKKVFRERRRTAAAKGLAFTITLDDIAKVPSHCPILGIELIPGQGSNNPSAPSLDRFDPKKGYVLGNVQWISWRANRLKGDGTIDEFKQLLEWMNGHIPQT